MSALPSIRDARLPAVYLDAQKALEKCHHIDECKTWADKAAAMASYARQSEDKSLLNTAIRIQARAIRRCGELLKQIAPAHGANQNITSGGRGKVTRKGAAKAAGLSDRQELQAKRVASIPRKDFEAAIEADEPATVAQLSEAGKREAAFLAKVSAPKPPGFQMATQTLGTLKRLAEFSREADVRLIVEAMEPHEIKSALANAKVSQRWLGKLIVKLEG